MLAELRTFALSDATVSGLIGNRFDPHKRLQGDQLPSVTYEVISALRRPMMLSTDNLPEKRIQIDAWGTNLSQAHAVAEAVRRALDGFKGTFGGSPGLEVQGVFADTERSTYEPDTKLFRVSRDYMIWAREDG